jgi:hypothetical protein
MFTTNNNSTPQTPQHMHLDDDDETDNFPAFNLSEAADDLCY